jgi:hypothetical protein
MEAERPFTIIDAGTPTVGSARIAGERVRVPAGDLQRALGWEVHDDLLCRDTMCVPVPPGSALVTDEGVDLGALATLLDRPLAVDRDERAAYLGVSAGERAGALSSLQAPDFSLPDLDGQLHALSEQRGRKVLLVAWASW